MSAELAVWLVRVVAFGPLMFAGLLMLLDPRSALDRIGLLQDGIHRFQGSLTNRRRFGPYPRREMVSHSGPARVFIRSTGVFLSLYALAGVAGCVL